MLRTTLPKGNSPKSVISKWRKVQPAKYELIYETDDQITRVSSSEPEIAWGECISYALAKDLIVLPEHWTCLRYDGDEWRAIYVTNGIVRRDEIIEPALSKLAEWLTVNVSDAVYSTCDVGFKGNIEITVVGELELTPEKWQLTEYKGSLAVIWLKRIVASSFLGGLILWASWPEPPPPPPPESLDPWYGYKMQWENSQLAGEALMKMGATCAAFSTFPLSRDIPGGTIDQGGINVVLPMDIPVEREVIKSWAQQYRFAISFDGATAFIRIPLNAENTWSSKVVNFNQLDARMYDLFTGLSLVTDSKVNFEPKGVNGVWTGRKASWNIISSPWMLMEIGKNLSALPVKLESGNFSINENGDCALNGAAIEFGGMS
ncbi:hypothetical protein ACET94_16685 [Aeromonas veronii]